MGQEIKSLQKWEPLDAQRILDGFAVQGGVCQLSPSVVVEAAQHGFRPAPPRMLRAAPSGRSDLYVWRGRVWVKLASNLNG